MSDRPNKRLPRQPDESEEEFGRRVVAEMDAYRAARDAARAQQRANGHVSAPAAPETPKPAPFAPKEVKKRSAAQRAAYASIRAIQDRRWGWLGAHGGELTGRERRVADHLVLTRKGRWEISEPMATLAAEIGLDRSDVWRALEGLVAKGFLTKRAAAPRRPARYRFKPV